jgi:hypothetical protein
MRWKSVAMAGTAWPVFAGCNIAYYTARNLTNEPLVVCTQVGIEHQLRSEARAVWQDVRGDYPRRAFTAEFHDGFVDGYVDYLDRGGNGSLPAVPPSKYSRHKKYFTEDGQCLVKDYFLGFKYGQEIAIATGKRQYLTVPVLLPQVPSGPPAFTLQPSDTQPMMPEPNPPAFPAQPAGGFQRLPRPVPKPAVTPAAAAMPEIPPNGPDALPAIPASGHVNLPPVVEVPLAPPAEPRFAPRLPPPPAEVPELPAHVPTPSVLDELPIVLPIHTIPPVVLPTHPER